MSNTLTETRNRPSVRPATDEISDLIAKISENARLARESEKELAALRRANEKSFAQMKKVLDRLSS